MTEDQGQTRGSYGIVEGGAEQSLLQAQERGIIFKIYFAWPESELST